MVRFVRKRDGSLASFDALRIQTAIRKAFRALGHNELPAAGVTARVVRELGEKFGAKPPRVEEIQDEVENALVQEGFSDVARTYVQYRAKHAKIRKLKTDFGIRDDLKFDVNAAVVLQRRYLLRNDKGDVVETPAQLFRRVARAIAAPDAQYGASHAHVEKTAERFYAAMSKREFVPNSPTLFNAGTLLGQLSACFVLPVEDSLEGIFDALKWQAVIQQSGGGTGFSFSRLRPKGDLVRSTHGAASGPVSFMTLFDKTTDVIKQGGRRRGANMGVLRCDHPDIFEFIAAKHDSRMLRNFNVSVAVTDAFLRAAQQDKEYGLINPRTGKAVRSVRARAVFDAIVESAWRTGDPGLIFIDEVNRLQPTPQLGEIEATNPCAEIPIQPFDSCNLGSINLTTVVDDAGRANWEKLRDLVQLGVHFLDNVIDANHYALPAIERKTKANRKIGLGVMGFAEYLLKRGVAYDSAAALREGEKVMAFIQKEARKASEELGRRRGNFPAFKGSRLERKTKHARNATVTTVAPTGTISIIAGCSSGIEPLFAVAFERNVLEGTRLLEVNALFEQIAVRRGFYSEELMKKIAAHGSVQGLSEVPKDVQKLFKTALEIPVEQHVKMQAAFQKNVENAVSKTVNLPENAKPSDVRKAYLLAWKLKCKGITIYRYGSKPEQVLTLGAKEGKPKPVTASSEYGGDNPGCADGSCAF